MELKTPAAHRAAMEMPRRGGAREVEAGAPPVKVLTAQRLPGAGKAGAADEAVAAKPTRT